MATTWYQSSVLRSIALLGGLLLILSGCHLHHHGRHGYHGGGYYSGGGHYDRGYHRGGGRRHHGGWRRERGYY